jgi:large subunit ribosomal protein L30
MADGKIRVTLVKGLAGTRRSHRDTIRGLGLRRLNHTVELADTAAVRGMIDKVRYLVRVEGAASCG